MLAAHIDNWLFFLFAAVAMLFRLLSSAADKSKTKSNENEEGPSRPMLPNVPRSQPQRGDSDSDNVRKFLEALGQPTGTVPPPPAAPRTNVPPRPLAPVQPPRTVFPRTKQAAPPPVPKIRLPEPSATRAPQSPAFEVDGGRAAQEPVRVLKPETIAPSTVARVGPNETSLIALLRSPSGLRNAIILREVFGPPRSLQSLEIGNL